MKLINLLSSVGILTIIATIKLNVEARRLKVRPLSAPEVYRILKEAGREDAVPEGRVVTQGLAAMTGFALGVSAGIGGALIFDLITANTTNSNNSTTSGLSFITQDICFQSRSLETDIQARNAEYDAEYDENEELGRQTSPTTTNPTGTTGTGTTATTPTTQTGTQTGTQTATGEDQTCITIQKPKSRKRRSTEPQKHYDLV